MEQKMTTTRGGVTVPKVLLDPARFADEFAKTHGHDFAFAFRKTGTVQWYDTTGDTSIRIPYDKVKSAVLASIEQTIQDTATTVSNPEGYLFSTRKIFLNPSTVENTYKMLIYRMDLHEEQWDEPRDDR